MALTSTVACARERELYTCTHRHSWVRLCCSSPVFPVIAPGARQTYGGAWEGSWRRPSLGAAWIVAAGSRLPAAVDARARQVLEGHTPVMDVLVGQALWLLLINDAIARLLLLAAIA